MSLNYFSQQCIRRIPLVLPIWDGRCSMSHDWSDYKSGTKIGSVPVIPKDKLSIKFVRSPGPGGQNVNKLATKAEVRFTVQDADWMPAAVRERFLEIHGNKLNKEGEMIVTCCEQRTQESNLKLAMEKLSALTEEACYIPKERIATTAPQSSVEYRLQQKKRRSDLKQSRSYSKFDW